VGSTSTTAANVMDLAASLMNDTAKSVYTYDAQMPYLNMALKELQEEFQLNNIPVTNEESAAIEIPIGTTEVCPVDGVGSGPAPNYPTDLVEIQKISERLAGSTDSFLPLVKKDFLPHIDEGIDMSSIQLWVWEGQRIKFHAALTAREIKIDYIKTLFPKVTNQAAVLGVINCETFLFYRTAALCTRFIGENETRAAELNDFAVMAKDRVIGIGNKGKQSIVTRRRPFMAAYKRRSFS
jgi:hypothetical protein